MDLELISKLGFSGNTLNPKERATLMVAMAKKKSDDSLLTDVLFWGKIQGTEDAYLICVGLEDKFTGVPAKKFFFQTATSRPDLAELPVVPAGTEFAVEAEKLKRTPFTGNPAETDPDAEADEGEGFQEKHRLAYTVAQIDAQVSVVPRGAYIVTPSHRVMKNPTYQGLSHSESASLRSFFHFRDPVQLKAMGALERKGLVTSTDFMDPISTDLPAGCWALKGNASKTMVTLSSLKFPGYHFFHKPGTSVYGGAYFGDGIENQDLIFMI